MEMMDRTAEDSREELRQKLRSNFDGRIVRKDLTKKIKEGANVPVYVLEFLLGQYCSSDDEAIIEQGVQSVKHILADYDDVFAGIVNVLLFDGEQIVAPDDLETVKDRSQYKADGRIRTTFIR